MNGLRKALLALAVTVTAVMLSCQQHAASDAWSPLFSEDFDAYPNGSELPAGWWHEGSKAVSIENGKLRADANLDGNGEDYECATLWLDRRFQGDTTTIGYSYALSGLDGL